MKQFKKLMGLAPVLMTIALVFLWAVDSDVDRNAMFIVAITGWLCVALDNAIAHLTEKIESTKKGGV